MIDDPVSNNAPQFAALGAVAALHELKRVYRKLGVQADPSIFRELDRLLSKFASPEWPETADALDADNYRMFARSAVVKCFAEGRIIDGILWSRIVAYYEAAVARKEGP